MMDRWDDRPWLQRAGDALSQFANVLLLNGMVDESISGRSYRNTVLRYRAGLPVALRWKIVRMFAEMLFYPLDTGHHTALAYWQDIDRARNRIKAAESPRGGE